MRTLKGLGAIGGQTRDTKSGLCSGEDSMGTKEENSVFSCCFLA